jgi:hypothetical protein
MPKILLFAPCEKVIIDHKENTVSLISILERVHIPIPMSHDAKLPDNVEIPTRWFLLSIWQREDNDGEQYEQRYEIVLPDGRSINPHSTDIKFHPHLNNARNVVEVGAWPLSMKGHCLVKLSLREVKPESQWREVATFPIYVDRPE